MSQIALPPAPGSVGLLSLAESLGIDANALVNAVSAAGRPESLAHLDAAEAAVARLREYTVQSLRRQHKSWSDIAHYLGTSKQSAHKKYAHFCV